MPAVDHAVAADAEHRGIDVGHQHQSLGTDQIGEAVGEVAGAGRQVEHPLARRTPGQLDREALPQAVHAERHQVVHHVVPGGDRVEHAAHEAGLSPGIDGAKPKCVVPFVCHGRVRVAP